MIGILDAYHFDLTPGSYQEKYMPMILSYLNKVIPNETFKHYHLAKNDFPTDIHECDGYIITGSPASCYEDIDWIKKLIEFIKELNISKKKTFGICFGHQVIAYALGGEVKKSPKGWGLGVSEFSIIKKAPWMNQGSSKHAKCSLIFFHQDQVTKLPPNATHIGTNNFCEYQIYSVENHIFSVQGHPEFNEDYAKMRTQSLNKQISQTFCQQRIESLSNEKDDLVFGKWIDDFFKSS